MMHNKKNLRKINVRKFHEGFFPDSNTLLPNTGGRTCTQDFSRVAEYDYYYIDKNGNKKRLESTI